MDELVTLPATVVTEIGPVVAPLGTVVVIDVDEAVVTVAVVPLNFTVFFAGVGSKLVPVIVTDVPACALVGAKLLIVGGPSNAKEPALVALPFAFVMEIVPTFASACAVTVSDVLDPDVTDP